jgi:hypothetical protein
MPDMKSLLFMSLFLMCAGTLSGWAVVDTLAGHPAGVSFLRFGLIIFFIVCAMQVFLFVMAPTRLFYQLIFSSSLLVSLTWMMMCLIMPIYWMPAISQSVRAGIFLLAFWLFACNGFKGSGQFKKRWGEKNPAAKEYYDSKQSTLDWDEITKSLSVSITVHIPGVSQRIMPFLFIPIILSMILGLNFRKVYPTASVFAWGIPCIIFSSSLIQMISFGIAQAFKILEIEDQVGARIRSKVN